MESNIYDDGCTDYTDSRRLTRAIRADLLEFISCDEPEFGLVKVVVNLAEWRQLNCDSIAFEATIRKSWTTEDDDLRIMMTLTDFQEFASFLCTRGFFVVKDLDDGDRSIVFPFVKQLRRLPDARHHEENMKKNDPFGCLVDASRTIR